MGAANRSIPRNHSDRADTLNLKAIPRDANPRASACAADFALRRHIETVFAIGEMVLVFADARRQIRRPRLAVTNGRVKSQLFGTVALGTVALLRVEGAMPATIAAQSTMTRTLARGRPAESVLQSRRDRSIETSCASFMLCNQPAAHLACAEFALL